MAVHNSENSGGRALSAGTPLATAPASSNFGENFPDLASSDTLSHKAAKTIEGVADSARTAMADTAETVGDATENAISAGKDGLTAIEDFVKANPLTVLVGTAAAGALVALLIANRGRPRRSDPRNWGHDLSRYTSDMQNAMRREMRSLVNDERVSKLVNSIPTAEVSKAVTPWISQVVEALSAAKTQAKAAAVNATEKVQDKLS